MSIYGCVRDVCRESIGPTPMCECDISACVEQTKFTILQLTQMCKWHYIHFSLHFSQNYRWTVWMTHTLNWWFIGWAKARMSCCVWHVNHRRPIWRTRNWRMFRHRLCTFRTTTATHSTIKRSCSRSMWQPMEHLRWRKTQRWTNL